MISRTILRHFGAGASMPFQGACVCLVFRSPGVPGRHSPLRMSTMPVGVQRA